MSACFLSLWAVQGVGGGGRVTTLFQLPSLLLDSACEARDEVSVLTCRWVYPPPAARVEASFSVAISTTCTRRDRAWSALAFLLYRGREKKRPAPSQLARWEERRGARGSALARCCGTARERMPLCLFLPLPFYQLLYETTKK